MQPTAPLLGLVTLSVLFSATSCAQPASPTYGERLGWGPDQRILIFHNDDAGMSHESNLGTIEGFEKGLLTSCSTMMPCSWVPEWADYLKEHPEIDNGLHLTLTSEWNHYRWGPVAGRDAVPGLVDAQGYMHRGVVETISNASADEVEKEIRAQIALAEKLGMPITHLDSHMGTLFYSPEFFERYVRIGIEKQIPIMIMDPKNLEGANRGAAEAANLAQAVQLAWDGGLPVLDHLMTSTADTSDPDEMIDALIQNLRDLKPGITQIILHGTRPGQNFGAISSSGGKREAELEMVLSDRVKQVIEEEGIVLTTYKELMARRQQVAAGTN
ncbi:MAG: polysaccharide deacetylase family protein [Candidatus Hydrogenedentes bacterium]|nr:polysaccharide deacetylase family protein [Candidatus Hydrogenedentota bacterium]